MSIKKSSKFGWLSLIVVALLLVTAFLRHGPCISMKQRNRVEEGKRAADDESRRHETRPEARGPGQRRRVCNSSGPASPAAVVAPAAEAPAQDIAQVSKLVEVEHPLK